MCHCVSNLFEMILYTFSQKNKHYSTPCTVHHYSTSWKKLWIFFWLFDDIWWHNCTSTPHTSFSEHVNIYSGPSGTCRAWPMNQLSKNRRGKKICKKISKVSPLAVLTLLFWVVVGTGRNETNFQDRPIQNIYFNVIIFYIKYTN